MAEAAFYAFFVGVLLGVFYDLLRILRLTFGGAFLLDLIFWFTAAIAVYCTLLVFTSGEVNGAVMLCASAGWAIYVTVIGSRFKPFWQKMAKKVKIRLKKMKKVPKSFKKVLQLPAKLYYNKKARQNHSGVVYKGDAGGKEK